MTMLRASLPMYDATPLQPGWDALWSLIGAGLAQRGIDAPFTLDRDTPYAALWHHPDLILSQTCGMPYRLGLHRELDVLGAFDFGLPGIAPGHYNSAIVVRADDPRRRPEALAGAVAAINSTDSQSGWAALTRWGGPVPDERRRITGTHADSIRSVASGEADLAAIDAVSWRNAQRFMDEARALAVIAWTKPTPGLPLVTRRGQPVEALADAVAEAVALMPPDAADLTGIRGFVRFTNADYLDAARF